MRRLFAFLYQRFAFAAFFSGIIGGIGSGLVSGRDAPAADIVAGVLYILSAAILAWTHGVLAEIDANALAASSASAGIIEASSLLDEQLLAKRSAIITLVTVAAVLLTSAVLIAGGFVSLGQ